MRKRTNLIASLVFLWVTVTCAQDRMWVNAKINGKPAADTAQ